MAATVLLAAVLAGGCGSAPPVPATVAPIDSPSFAATAGTTAVPTSSPSSESSGSPSGAPTSSPTDESTQAPQTPFVAEREYVSDDGQLTMLVPEGAIPPDVTLTAVARGQGDLPLELMGLQVRNAFYEVGPSSAVFASVVRMERAARLKDLDIDLAAEGLPLLAMAMRSPGAQWSWLDDPELSVEDRSLVVRGDAASVGLLFAFGGRDATTLEWSVPDRVVPVGSTVTLNVSLASGEEEVSPPVLGSIAPVVAPGIIESDSTSDSDGRAAMAVFRCVAAGEAPVGVTYEVSNLFAESVLFGQLGLGPASTNVTVTQTVTCSQDVTPPPTTTPGSSETPVASAPSL